MAACRERSFRLVGAYLKAVGWLIVTIPGILTKRRWVQRRRRKRDDQVWTDARVEDRNPFIERDRPVMSVLAVRAALDETIEYRGYKLGP